MGPYSFMKESPPPRYTIRLDDLEESVAPSSFPAAKMGVTFLDDGLIRSTSEAPYFKIIEYLKALGAELPSRVVLYDMVRAIEGEKRMYEAVIYLLETLILLRAEIITKEDVLNKEQSGSIADISQLLTMLRKRERLSDALSMLEKLYDEYIELTERLFERSHDASEHE